MIYTQAMKTSKMIIILGILCLSTTTTGQAVCKPDVKECEGLSTILCQLAGIKTKCGKLCGECTLATKEECTDQLLCGGLTNAVCKLGFADVDMKEACPALCEKDKAGSDDKCVKPKCTAECENDGECTGAAVCLCKKGTSGNSCEIKDCEPECLNGGTCIGNIGDTKCDCVKGTSGQDCGTKDCEPECLNGGTCIGEIGNTECLCPHGTSGKDCGKKECTLECKNGGTCIDASTCKCTPDWSGEFCQTQVCNPLCKNGQCNAQFTCDCDDGFLGTACDEVEIKDCGNDYEKVNNLCLIFSTDKKTWSQAKVECARINGKLVEENVEKMTAHMFKNKMTAQQFWVGASDKDTSGVYKWLTGGGSITKEQDLWVTGFTNPAVDVAKGKSCVTLWSTEFFRGLVALSNTDCNGPYYHRYICQKI